MFGAATHHYAGIGARWRDGAPEFLPHRYTESRSTPQATRAAPAQRCHATFSFKTTFARNVSSTYVAAVAGTAKLRSATDRSLRNAKNEIAMQPIARISSRRRRRVANMRPSADGRKSLTSP